MRKSLLQAVIRSLQMDNQQHLTPARTAPHTDQPPEPAPDSELTARNRARLYPNTLQRVPQNQPQSSLWCATTKHVQFPRQKAGTLTINLSRHSLHCCKAIIRKGFEELTTNSASCNACVKYTSNHSCSTDSGMKLMAISPSCSKSIIRQCKVARKPMKIRTHILACEAGRSFSSTEFFLTAIWSFKIIST